MKRKEFLRNSILGSAGVLLFPWKLFADLPSNKFKKFELPDLVPQPRHGNFTGASFEVDDNLLIHSRDRLLKNGLDLSPEDLLSINMEFKGKRMNLTVSDKECWINDEKESEKMNIYPGVYPIAEDMEIIMGYSNIAKCSTKSKLYILPLAGQFKIDDLLYHENTCILAEDVKTMNIETSQSSRILLLSA